MTDDFRQRFIDRVNAHRAAFQPPKAEPNDVAKVMAYDRATGRFVLASRDGQALRGSASSGAMPIGTQATQRQKRFDTLQPPKTRLQPRSVFIRRPGFAKVQVVFWIDTGTSIDWYLGGDRQQPLFLGSWPTEPVFVGHTNLGNGRYIVALADAITGNSTTGQFVSGARQLSSDFAQIWQRFDSVRQADYLGYGFWGSYLRWNFVNDGAGTTTNSVAWSQLYFGNYALSDIATETSSSIAVGPSEQETTQSLTPFNLTYLDKTWVDQFYSYSYVNSYAAPGDPPNAGYGNSNSNYHDIYVFVIGANNASAITYKSDWNYTTTFDNNVPNYSESGTAFGTTYSVSSASASPAYYRYFLEFSGAASPIEITPDFLSYYANLNLIGGTLYDVPNPNYSLRTQLTIAGQPIEIDIGERRLDIAPATRTVKPALVWPLVVGGVPFSGIYSLSYNPS